MAAGFDLRQQLAQRLFGCDGGIDDRLPGRRDIAFHLFERRLAEGVLVPVDEIGPVGLAFRCRPTAS